MKKYLGLITIVAFVALALVGCKKEEPKKNGGSTIVQVKTVKIDPETKTLKVGDSFEFTVTVDPATVSHEVSVDNAEIVKVEGNKATALAEGKAVITATAGGKTATLTVTVTKDGNVEVDQTRVVEDIYFPPVETFEVSGKMTAHKEQIVKAMATDLGYEFSPFKDDPEFTNTFPFWRKDGDKSKNFQLVSYTHNPTEGRVFMIAATMLNPNSFNKDLGLELLNAYGFSKGASEGTLNDEQKTYCVFGVNESLGLEALLFAKPANKGESELLTMQITPPTPKGQSMVKKAISVRNMDIELINHKF